MEPLISHINKVNENSEKQILSAENDELANDDDNIYSDSSDPSEFRVSDSFNDWNMVQDRVNMYVKHHSFVVSKYRLDLNTIDKSIVQRRIFKYWKFGVNKPKKVENISLHHDSTSGEIRLTKFVNIHNHQCDTKTIELALRNFRLSQSILDKIEHYTLNGQLIADQQYDLLLKEFSQHRICNKNLYNAINKFRGVQTHDEFDASTLFSYLLRQHDNDPNFVVISRLESQSNELTDVKKKARCKLHGDMVKNFIGDFYHMRNSYTQTQFDLRFNDILSKYEPYRSYLENKLYPSHYYGLNPSVGLPSTFNTIFKEIDNILQAHLSLIPLSLQQINQVTESNSTFGDIIEHEYDLPQIRLHELILEISYIATTSSSPTTPHYLFEVISSDTNVVITQKMKTSANISLQYIEQIRPTNVIIPAIREKVNKKVQFGTAMSLAKTSVQIAVSE
ncbi:20393_t:CDS:2, partial [Rhizophagus irregularis]